MLKNNTKKVVIMNDIKCKHIEQAIFVLKEEEDVVDEHFILDEAYRIINKYIESSEEKDNIFTRIFGFFRRML